MRKPATDTLLNRIKRDAKEGVSPTKTYMQALDELAISAGYEGWRAIAKANGERKATEGDDIPLDPVLPRNFDNRANETRSKAELDRFWRRPFIVSRDDGQYEVRCLDGVWDRATWYGIAGSVEAARSLARKKLSEWISIVDRPVMAMRGDGLVDLLQMNHRPDESPVMYAVGLTQQAAKQLLSQYDADHPESQ